MVVYLRLPLSSHFECLVQLVDSGFPLAYPVQYDCLSLGYAITFLESYLICFSHSLSRSPQHFHHLAVPWLNKELFFYFLELYAIAGIRILHLRQHVFYVSLVEFLPILATQTLWTLYQYYCCYNYSFSLL